MELNDHIIHLITRHLNGETTPAEEEELQAWLEQDAANRRELEVYEKLWSDSAGVVESRSFDTGAAWQKLDTKIRATRSAAKVISIRRIAVAAAILSFVVLSVYYLLQADGGLKEAVTATNGNRQIDLPDGSVVTLRRGSTLRYPEQFPQEKREVELDGEAFFDVRENAASPFQVTTSRTKVEVLGTAFLVRETDSTGQVVVTSGKVAFSDRKQPDTRVVLLKDQQATLSGNRMIKDTVLNKNFLSWESGRLIFDNTPLQQVATDIGHLFGVTVQVAPGTESAGPIRIKAEFNSEPLEQVLEQLELMTGLQISRRNGVVVIGR